MYLVNGKYATYLISSNNTKINSIKDIVSSIVEFTEEEINELQKSEISNSLKTFFKNCNVIFLENETDSITNILIDYAERKETGINYDENSTIKINNDCSFILPSGLEVQSGSWKRFNDYTSKKLGKEYQSEKLWLQQKGLNENKKGCMDHYIRISISCKYLDENSLSDASIKPEISNEELKEFDSGFDEELRNYKYSKVLTINKAIIFKFGNYFSLMKSFTSQMSTKPIKKSERHIIFHYNKMINIEIEYWTTDYKIFKDDLNTFTNTFKIL